MTTEILWAVKTNTDLTEGRGREYVKAFCKLRATAIRLSKRGYVQGSDCPVEPVEVMLLDGKRVLPASVVLVQEPNFDDEATEKRIIAGEDALAKAKGLGLTDDEVLALRSLT